MEKINYISHLKPYLEGCLDKDLENQRDENKFYEGFLVGYLTRVLYQKDKGIETAIEESQDFVEDNWKQIVELINKEDTTEEVVAEKDPFSSYSNLYLNGTP